MEDKKDKRLRTEEMPDDYPAYGNLYSKKDFTEKEARKEAEEFFQNGNFYTPTSKSTIKAVGVLKGGEEEKKLVSPDFQENINSVPDYNERQEEGIATAYLAIKDF